MKLPGNVQKIVVFRALQLGDMLCLIPAMRALRHAYPHAHIILAGLPWAKAFTERFNQYFDDFIWFPGYPGLPEQAVNAVEFVNFLGRVQQEKYDLALQMQGNGTLVNPMVELFNATYTAGFYTENDYAPNLDFFLKYPDHGAETERHLLLMKHLGIPGQGSKLEFPLTAKDYEEYNELHLELKPHSYVCIHPGSRGSWRQWPTSYFAGLADYCAECGFTPVITGTKDETGIANEVISKMKHQPLNLVGKTTLGAIAISISNAYALISNCTGVSHIAAAFETPSIVISMDGEPERWGPGNKHLHKTIDWLKQPDYQLVFDKTVSLLHSSHNR